MTNNRFIKATKRLWRSKATIYGKTAAKDDLFDDVSDKLIVADEPCKVILKGLNADTMNMVNNQIYNAKLLIRNGIDIPSGAKITITDVNGHTTKYKQASSGYTAYPSHQEVAMIYSEVAKE
ncbi:hypothetical protein [Apilactobacillus xinyiensis]|uniref:hypothetical protein n=1 Tax=Apilactobacillus xinyiensis TaxID=2841032 RepID=UPI00200C243E|nr:hypothetical protein [Apilactobacillus xinyiensis]MCL0330608.1 hypothetical protein [Apilactobacillus xinyiensis]